jgi:alpha-N-arabinofuranosidase
MRSCSFRTSAWFGIASLCVTAVALSATDVTKIQIDPRQTGPTIDRHIFGQFSEHLGSGIYGGIWVGTNSPIPNTRGIRNDVVAALRAIHVPDVRWPGGCFADEYHWRNGIGPVDRRPVTLNSNWGGVVEPNTFGTAEYFDFIEQIGADAYISGNVGSGSPREVAEWLEYLTSDKPTALQQERAANGHVAPYQVEFFGIGNETWGCGGSMTPEEYAGEYRKFATFAKSFNPAQAGEAKMQRIASGADGENTAWTEVMMKHYLERVFSWDMEGLSLHYYSGFDKFPPTGIATGFDEAQYAKLLRSTLKMDDLVARHSAIMDKYDPGKKVALVVDEWGAWYSAEQGTNPQFLHQQNSQRDAILAALNLDIFARHADRVRMANIAQTINVLQAMIFTDGSRMLLTPTYFVYKLYCPFQDASVVPVKFDAGAYTYDGITLPRLDVIAAKAKDGRIYLALTNVDPHRPLAVNLSVMGFKASSAAGETLVAPKMDSVNTFDHPRTVSLQRIEVGSKDGALTLDLAPESVTVVSLR